MVSPEFPTLDTLKAELETVSDKIERANEFANSVDGHFLLKALWERHDELEAEIEETDLPPETP